MSSDITVERELQRELAEAVRLRDSFIGILGHDLRSPLTAIILGSQQLARRSFACAASR